MKAPGQNVPNGASQDHGRKMLAEAKAYEGDSRAEHPDDCKKADKLWSKTRQTRKLTEDWLAANAIGESTPLQDSQCLTEHEDRFNGSSAANEKFSDCLDVCHPRRGRARVESDFRLRQT